MNFFKRFLNGGLSPIHMFNALEVTEKEILSSENQKQLYCQLIKALIIHNEKLQFIANMNGYDEQKIFKLAMSRQAVQTLIRMDFKKHMISENMSLVDESVDRIYDGVKPFL